MNIKKATRDFERWLAEQTTLDEKDLAYKHRQMADGKHVFPFLRATYYRWARVWPEVCPDLAGAPTVLAVGDLHVENFGTWRDAEGRLVWGINDFDEAYPLPWTNDLVRLAVSMIMAVKASPLKASPRKACATILNGYRKGLQSGGRPFVLGEKHPTLRAMALSRPRNPVLFWRKLRKLIRRKEPKAPAEVRSALQKLLPDARLEFHLRRRPRVGLGSLGKPRFVALASWAGGMIAREAKALTPSACAWASGKGDSRETWYRQVVDAAVRCPDPFLEARKGWVLRRLAPDCSRIELESLATVEDESRLLYAMGWETANVHLGSRNAAREVLAHLERRPAGWLLRAAKAMTRATRDDWKEWKDSK